MGNCQATSDVVGILVEHPDGRIEKLYWSLTARQLMLQYPGNYVAIVRAAPVSPDHKTPLRVVSSKLKLLPPDTTLQVGQHYRLISFEDVLLELSDQKCVERSSARSKPIYSEQSTEDDEEEPLGADEDRQKFMEGFSSMRSLTFSRSAQWRPALQSISELGR